MLEPYGNATELTFGPDKDLELRLLPTFVVQDLELELTQIAIRLFATIIPA